MLCVRIQENEYGVNNLADLFVNRSAFFVNESELYVVCPGF